MNKWDVINHNESNPAKLDSEISKGKGNTETKKKSYVMRSSKMSLKSKKSNSIF